MGKAGVRIAQGVVVAVSPGIIGNAVSASQRLVNALLGFGIYAKVEPDDKLKATPEIINIIVGTKH
jgi:hypothetical protein